MKYRFFLFDADDTLFNFQKAQEFAFKQSISYFSINYHVDALYAEFKKTNKELWTLFTKGLTTKEDFQVNRFQSLFQTHNIKSSSKLVAEYFSNTLSQCIFLQPGAEIICNFIIEKNFKIGIISNGFKSEQYSRIRSSEISKFINCVTISEECNCFKPDPKIFEIALSKFNSPSKTEVLMVGNNLFTDIKGANNFGMDSCWYNPSYKNNSAEVEFTFQISDLLQLKKVLS